MPGLRILRLPAATYDAERGKDEKIGGKNQMKIRIANIAAQKYGRMRICYNGPGKNLTAECALAAEEVPYIPESRKDAENAVWIMYSGNAWGLIWYENKVENVLWGLRNK